MYLQEESFLRPLFAEYAAGQRAQRVADADTGERVSVSVRLRGRLRFPRQSSSAPVGHRQYLSRKVFAETHAASDADVERVVQFGRAHGLRVVARSATCRRIVLMGPVKQMSRAFSVEFSLCEDVSAADPHWFRMIQIPTELLEVAESIQEWESHPVRRSASCESENRRSLESFCLRADYLA